MSIFSLRFPSGKRPSTRLARGFTLIELLVVMSIMVVISGVLLVRQSQYDSSTLLRSLAYSVALSVRQAQVYGTSVFGTTTGSLNCGSGTYANNTCFAPGYGIYVDINNPTGYTLFADLDNNGTYNNTGSGIAEQVKGYTFGQGYYISKICATAGSTQYCSGSGISTLSISFRRPNPEACFTTDDPSSQGWTTACAPGAIPAFSSALIQIQANGGDISSTRSIFINTTGQISVGGAGT